MDRLRLRDGMYLLFPMILDDFSPIKDPKKIISADGGARSARRFE